MARVTGVRSEAGKGNVLLGLTRPRLGVLGMITVLFCNLLAAMTPGSAATAAGSTGLIVGGALALAGASALNQFERRPDALMRRTAGRPLPTGRISPLAAGLIGLLLTAGGLAVLAASVGLSTAVGTMLAGVLSYSLVYTPLKQRSSLNTIVGAFPGAIPALMGWSAARALTPDAWVIFGVLALWQVPHFLAIAWLYRADYQRAGFQMLEEVRPTAPTWAVRACSSPLPSSPAPCCSCSAAMPDRSTARAHSPWACIMSAPAEGCSWSLHRSTLDGS